MTTTTPSTTPAEIYALLPPDRSADELERELLARWERDQLFARTLEQNAGGPSFVFFEGPPTANGRPGIHHVFGRTIKDLFCRYWAMKGYRVARKAGWDTHGLPVEIEVEKQLGISGKQQIEAIGVAEFNRLCRESVFRYREDWERLSARIGYWLDYAHPYVTFSNDYVESVWWALATLHERGLLVRGHKILPYCPRCGTALSSHEVAQGYADVEDPSVYVALDAWQGDAENGGMPGAAPGSPSAVSRPSAGRRILVWTTTPWTLVSNAALAVNPDLEYVEVRRRSGGDERMLILAASRLAPVLGEDHDSRWEIVGRRRGVELVGWRYRRPFDWLPYPEGRAHEIIVGESFVSAEEGTGVVHMAPAFGADDYAAGQRHDLAFLQPVDARGRFPRDLPVAGGEFVKDADPLLIEELQRRGVLFRAGRITHAYPHCWRCDTPLLYYARTSWFVRTTAYRDAMLARNARVDWHPVEVGDGRFGEWLKNNIDWAISRDRYWGTPLPVWVCDAHEQHVDVIGSYAALARRAGTDTPLTPGFDPHKPFVDEYTWRCTQPGCHGTMRRVPEVIDTWFDSGSMSFAQWHYPFENRAHLASQYPADFIAEGVDQTRGWFYSLLAVATGLGDALPNNAVLGESDGDPGTPALASSDRGPERLQPTPHDTAPYRSVVVNDNVLDADGSKMSKSRGNVVDPWRMIDRYGVDAIRLFLVASSNVWVPRRFDERVLREQAGRFLLTLKNVYSGIFAQYANFGWTPSPLDPAVAARPPIDRWVLGRLIALENAVDAAYARYDVTDAARAIMQFVEDDLANWYVRLSRARFYEVDADDNRAAFATLHEVLASVCRLLAPIAPFVTDWMHRQLVGSSVHLAPLIVVRTAGAPVDGATLDAGMQAIRVLARLGRAAREEAGIRVRQPLARVVCVAPHVDEETLAVLLPLLRAELNVKQIDFASSADALVTLEAKPNYRSLGKKFAKKTPLAARAIAAFSSEDLRRLEQGEPLAVTVDGETHAVEREDVTIIRRATGALVVQEDGGFFTAIDPSITPALHLEGLARELISRVQRMRKEAGLAVSDRIAVTVVGSEDLRAAVEEHGAWIASEILATELVVRSELPAHQDATQVVDLDGGPAHVALIRIR
ncbi:MAG TPA: isoleucine--tRNA ligase [Gemmatimonadaceae bacterium]|nr:isoleucine--tRNA ligase [Gemmatimonadaceae bacterium]